MTLYFLKLGIWSLCIQSPILCPIVETYLEMVSEMYIDNSTGSKLDVHVFDMTVFSLSDKNSYFYLSSNPNERLNLYYMYMYFGVL